MTHRRTVTAFAAIALLAAVTTAATIRPQAPNAAEREFAAGPKPMPEIRKPVRYEAIISNWKRYRSTARASS